MNWKLALLTGLVTPLVAVGCNSNPIDVPTGVDTPVLFSQNPDDGLQKVDLLWMIDDSGSMAEEQISVVNGIKPLAGTLSLVDFNIAVVSTTTKSNFTVGQKTCWDGTALGPCQLGQFHEAADLQFSTFNVKNTKNGDIKAIVNQLKSCVETPTKAQWDEVEKVLGSLGGDDKKIERPAFDNLNAALAKLTPRKIGPVLRRSDYLSNGKVDVERLKNDLSCLTLVGTNGYGVEKGLEAVVKAVTPNGINKKYDFVRKKANMVVVLVSDENDCSHEPVACENNPDKTCNFDDFDCNTKLCNYYNHKSFNDSKFNPLRSPSVYAKRFLKALREAKKEPNFSNVSAVAITGADLPQPGETKKVTSSATGNTVDKTNSTVSTSPLQTILPPDTSTCKTVKKEMEACNNEFGIAVSGDRYYRFIREFKVSFPEEINGIGDSGALCLGDSGFSDSFKALGAFVSGEKGKCITRPLLKCNGNPGDKCGPSGEGECTAYPSDGLPKGVRAGDLFCSAAVNLVASGPTSEIEKLKSQKACIGDKVEGIDGTTSSCLLQIDSFVGCPDKTSFTYELKKGITVPGNVSLDLRFTGFDVEEDN